MRERTRLYGLCLMLLVRCLRPSGVGVHDRRSPSEPSHSAVACLGEASQAERERKGNSVADLTKRLFNPLQRK